jgi:hypothetical protein
MRGVPRKAAAILFRSSGEFGKCSHEGENTRKVAANDVWSTNGTSLFLWPSAFVRVFRGSMSVAILT